MTTVKDQIELYDKIISGLQETHEKLIEFKKKNNSVLVVMKNGKIVKIKPE